MDQSRKSSVMRMTSLVMVVICSCSLLPPSCDAFIPTTITTKLQKNYPLLGSSTDSNEDDSINMNNSINDSSSLSNRRQLLNRASSSLLIGGAFLLDHPLNAHADIEGVATPSPEDPNPVQTTLDSQSPTTPVPTNDKEVILYQTKSGLKYINLREATGPTPKYGNLISISYKAYIKLPTIKGVEQKLQEFDSDGAYLIKHGNGRIIPGLDEGLHTLPVGGKRRIIIPPKLGYVGPGVLGPLPSSPWGRYRLNSLTDQMIAVKGGNLVFDVEMRSIMEDEADQGYYEDESLTPEEFETLRQNLSQRAQEAKEKGVFAVDFLSAVGQDEEG